MKIDKLDEKFGINARNLIDLTKEKSLSGALACIETFYYAFNNRDLDVFNEIWLNHDLIQLNNPLGGIIRGIVPISEMYDRIFNGQARVWVELSDIVMYQSDDTVIFAGREIGESSSNDNTIDLQIRTTRIFGFSETDNQWFQIHHHGSIDDAHLLERYQKSVKSKD